MKKILVLLLSCLSFSASAMVLDWSGSYEAEMFFLQQGSVGWESGTTHNLRLKPDIKVFDGLRVRAWFQLSTQSFDESTSKLKFYPQTGPVFQTDESASLFPVNLQARDVYMELSHSFGLLQFGWKTHHFGMGMYYNDASELFDPVYNVEGSQGMISWRGMLGSYYIQPILHYIDSLSFNAFIQGGWAKEKYGVEGIYKRAGVGLSSGDTEATTQQDYMGLYAYLNMSSFNVALEGGNSGGSYGAAVDVDWQSPWKKMVVGLDVALSTSSNEDTFYFDPNFTSGFSVTLGLYEAFKQEKEEYFKEYGGYAFHNAILVKPSVAVSLSKSITLEGVVLARASSDMSNLTYGAEAIFAYQLDKGLEWNTGAGVVLPADDNFQIGVCTQVAITF